MDGLRAPEPREPKKIARKKINKITKAKKENMSDKKSALTNLLSIFVTALIVGGAIYAWQDRAKDDSLSKVQTDARNVREGYERSIKNLENKVRQAEDEKENLSSINEELKSKAELVEGALMEYQSEELGLGFSYPAILGKANYKKEGGTSGEKFTINFSNTDNFYMSGVSSDYKGDTEISTTTNEADFMNFVRLEENRGAYKFFVLANGEEKEYELKPVEVIPFSGGEALLVDANSFVLGEDQVKINIGQNLGAILNTKKDVFSGVAMLDSDFGQLSVDKFKKILKSIELK